MRKLLLAVAALLLMPPASAGQTYNDSLDLNYDPTGTGIINVPVSTPLDQRARFYNITLNQGDEVAVNLAWSDTSGGFNDLDLTLLLPSAAPIPVNVDADTIVAIAQSRVVRTTCMDAPAKSNQHSGSGEAFDYTIPAGGEQGKYILVVRGWLLTVEQPYAVTITVTSGGSDVTASRVVQDPTETNLITSNPHCELL
jgi:hypothetical protein